MEVSPKALLECPTETPIEALIESPNGLPDKDVNAPEEALVKPFRLLSQEFL